MIKRSLRFFISIFVAGNVCSGYCTQKLDSNFYFDCRPSVTVMIEGGVGFSQNTYRTRWNNGFMKSSTSFGTYHALAGLRAGIRKMVNSNWFIGASIGGRYLGGKEKDFETSYLDTSMYYRVLHPYTLGASLIGGLSFDNKGSFYGKVGPILGKFNVSMQYWNTLLQVKKYNTGVSFGAGYDVPINGRYSLGSLVEYDYFKKIKGSLGGDSLASYSLKPSLLNVLMVFSIKLF